MAANSTSSVLTDSVKINESIIFNSIKSPLDIGDNLYPFWILCEATSGCLTLISLYIAAVLVKHARRQSASRLAKRRRDSIMFPSVKFSSNENSNKRHPDGPTSFPKDNMAEPNFTKIPYNEQMSVESAKSNSNLIVTTPVSAKAEFTFPQGQVIAVHRSNKENKQGKWLLRSILVCVFSVVLRCIAEQCLILLGNWTDLACDILTKVMIAFTAVSLHCCHVFLWLRQLTFYSNPVLKPLRSKKLKILSYAAYGVMPLTLAVTLALYMWWRDYENLEGFCVASKDQNLPSYVPFSVLVACTVTIQVLLSSLFLYPLLVHKLRRRNSATISKAKQEDSGTESQSTTLPAVKSRKGDKLMECIKRVLHGATVGITTDVVGGVVSIFLPDDIPIFALSVLYNLNVSLNLLCLIYTFANWRQMLFPWCCPSRQEKEFRNSRRLRRSSQRQRNKVYAQNSRRPSQKGKTVFATKYTMRDVDT